MKQTNRSGAVVYCPPHKDVGRYLEIMRDLNGDKDLDVGRHPDGGKDLDIGKHPNRGKIPTAQDRHAKIPTAQDRPKTST